MKAIINRKGIFGTLNGVVKCNTEIQTEINFNLKNGTAKLILETDDKLIYELSAESPKANMHPIFQDLLAPFGIR